MGGKRERARRGGQTDRPNDGGGLSLAPPSVLSPSTHDIRASACMRACVAGRPKSSTAFASSASARIRDSETEGGAIFRSLESRENGMPASAMTRFSCPVVVQRVHNHVNFGAVTKPQGTFLKLNNIQCR